VFILREQAFDAISQGVTYLCSQQQKDGSFLSLSSPRQDNFTKTLIFHSTFSTSLILDSLHSIPKKSNLQDVKRKASLFLLNQKSTHWSFNYWTRNSEQAKKLPYPDDLDDTSCALAALFHYDRTIIDGSVLAHVVRLFTSTEVKEGGPYRTWLVPEDADNIWKDIDIAVNSNVAYFLSLYEIALPQLTGYIEDRIINNKLFSPYYPTEFPIFYFISRFYNGKYKNKLIESLLAKRNSKYTWDNPLNTALAMSTICNLQGSVDKLDESVHYLLQTQMHGSWKPNPFYTGVNPKKDKPYFAGSSALVTALCLEALSKYLHAISIGIEERREHSSIKEAQLHGQIMQKVEKRFSILDKKIYGNTLGILDKIIKNDKQISLLPYYFTQTLGEKKKNVPEEFLIDLGIANVFGWLAYTIYDDFLDGEGNPQLLSVANIALRSLCYIYENILPERVGFTKLFFTIMDTLDFANAWETVNCRIVISNNIFDLRNFVIPNSLGYESLAEKSFGHALGPVALLFLLGYNKNSPEVRSLLLFFKHYLIMRQLNDDAHDWKQDLLRGYCNSVGLLLMNKIHFDSSGKISTEKHIQKMQKIFWHETIIEVCAQINEHAHSARQALNNCSVIVDSHPLEQLLVPYENISREALAERMSILKFLRTYSSAPNSLKNFSGKKIWNKIERSKS
jgi:hypothetical protein